MGIGFGFTAWFTMYTATAVTLLDPLLFPTVALSTLRAVAVKDANHVWVVGDNDTWLVCNANCTKSNATWTSLLQGQLAALTTNLYGLAYFDNSHVWAVGSSPVLGSQGTVLFCKSSCDKGASASVAQQSVGTADYRAAVTTAGNQAWVVGSGGDVEFTDGSTWAQQAAPTPNFRGLAAFDPNHLYAVGEGGAIAACTDVCTDPANATWANQESGVGIRLNGIAAVSATQQWAVGDNGTILTTLSGSSSWTQQDSDLYSQLVAPVCQPGTDPLVSFATDDGSGGLSVASYYVTTGSSPALVRQSCTAVAKDLSDLTQGYTVSNNAQIILGHFLGSVAPTLKCDGSTDPTTCDSARAISVDVAVTCIDKSPSNAKDPACPGDTTKVRVAAPWSFTLSATRRSS